MARQFINPRTLVDDTVAGMTLGIESIPDAMASALLAAVNPIHGVYAVMLATPVGALFASSVFMSVQTTSAMSLIVASVPQVHSGDNAVAALFGLAIAGAEELEIAAAAADVAGELVEEAVAEAVVGGAELGTASAMDAVAEALEEASEE